jgi:hypothetical protein
VATAREARSGSYSDLSSECKAWLRAELVYVLSVWQRIRRRDSADVEHVVPWMAIEPEYFRR